MGSLSPTAEHGWPQDRVARRCLSAQSWDHGEGQASAPVPGCPSTTTGSCSWAHCLTVGLTPPWSPTAAACALQRTGNQGPQGPHTCRGPASQAAPTFTNILLPWAAWPGRVGVQYTDMDFRSRENSRVNSFRISCRMTCGAQVGQGVRGRASAPWLSHQPPASQEPLAMEGRRLPSDPGT